MAESSPGPEQVEVAGLLARRARVDQLAAHKLAPDPEIDESVVGFHAQQAVEKALKASLTLRSIDFPKTHDLDFLILLAKRGGIAIPADLIASGWLTPWAAEFRYDDAPLDSLDEERALSLAEEAASWSEELVARALG